MDDVISRRAAIDALDEIRHALWEIDIPSPTVPEYVEHHEQVQSVWKLLDKKQKELYVLSSAQPEITDEQAILHLQTSGWMQTHDKEMYEMGLREKLADDSDSYDALLPSAQPEVKKISYVDCANAMLMMWIDEVLTDGEYNRIMDKLNEHEKKKGKDNE